ncbi:uncharacterized protein LOC128252860 isoform X1 [Drosophila gunungcola]|uniref:uncharacterized protein LOC128252860 isoform X1 n=1 Tax=Drosophila gunungcola TaxID=103775 RepID=UPI0022E26820|nr:uncharacterized protein LOC128252860 isoform X1 [Drosophila gunungcola]
MKYFKFYWLLIVVVLFICSQNAEAAPKRKAKPKIHLPKLPKININIHHNNYIFRHPHRIALDSIKQAVV